MAPRRQHYVPEWLSSRWANEHREIWAINKSTRSIFRPNVKNIFLEKDLYTLFDDTGKPNAIVEEHFYGKIDSKLSVLTDRLVEQVLRNDPPKFSSLKSKVQFLELTCRVQMMRGPDAINSELETIEIDKIFDVVKSRRIDAGEFSQAEDDMLKNENIRASIVRESKIRARITHTSDLLKSGFENSIVEFYIAPMGSSYILSDGVIDGKIGTLQSGSTMLMPIHPRVALRPLFDKGKTLRAVIRSLRRDDLRNINERLYAQSDFVAAATKEQLVSLDRRFNVPLR
jgi:Protein of unknown function (DUF4238)